MDKTAKHKNNFFLLLLLLISAAVGFLKLPIIPGIDFVFGSIITVVIIILYGTRWGLLSALLSTVYTSILWNHPYAFIPFLLEAAFLGVVYGKTKKNIALIDIVFWVFIGIPIAFLFYKGRIGLSTTAIELVVLKQSLNSIFNALVGCILINGLYSYGFIDLNYKIKYSNLIYNVIMLFVLIPTLGFVVYHGQAEYKLFEQKAKEEISIMAANVNQDMGIWSSYHIKPISELASELSSTDIDTAEIQKKLDLLKRSMPDLSTIYVANANGKTISFAPIRNEKGESTIGLDFSDRDYYHHVKERKSPFISDAFMGRGGVFEPMVTISMPIIKDNKFAGFVNGSIKLDSITRNLQAISRKNFNITLLDSKQQVIATTSPLFVALDKHTVYAQHAMITINPNLYYIAMNKESRSKLNSLENSYYVYINNEFGDRFNTKQTLLIEMPIGPTYNDLYNQLSNTLLLAMFVLILAIIIGYFGSRKIVQSLWHITEKAEDLPVNITSQRTSAVSQNWPRSNIYEVSRLIRTFQIIEKRLLDSFTEIRRNEARFKYLAHHDPLTRLPNKTYFMRNVSENLKDCQQIIAIMFIDLDRFKVVNDTLGHSEGDRLLIQVSDRLRSLVNDQDVVARQGGDEFLISLNAANIEEIEMKARKFLKELSKPYYLGDWTFDITATIGISIYPHHGDTLEILVKNADIAMYEAKVAGKNNFSYFEEKHLQHVQNKMEMEKKLKNALKNQEFELYYQPLFNIGSQQINGSEALIRWRNPETKTYIPPLEFIPLAEETGIIVPLGEWVLKTATVQIVDWQKKTGLQIGLSINVSARQFINENFVNAISEALQESGLKPESLTLEITESKVMEQLEVAIRKMAELKLLGVKLALDDFGTGYSSLSYLKEFSLDTVKIDKSFIADMLTNKYNESLVKAIIDVAHTINLNVVAEGVEREDQLQALRELGCDYFQGYLLSKPLTVQEFEQLLTEEK